MNIFLELFGKLFDGWCKICDFFAGHTVDALEGIAMFVIFFPFIAALIATGINYWWSITAHRQMVGVFLFVGAYVPTLVVFAISVLAENKEPLVKGTHRKMRKFRSLVAEYLINIDKKEKGE